MLHIYAVIARTHAVAETRQSWCTCISLDSGCNPYIASHRRVALFVDKHRLGQVLMRLRISKDMGLNNGRMLGVGLLLATALRHVPCRPAPVRTC